MINVTMSEAAADVSDAGKLDMTAVAAAVPAGTTPKNKPPGRVRYMFKKMDADNSGSVSKPELMAGFKEEFKVDLAKHVTDWIDEAFEKHATDCNGEKALSNKVFGRFYAGVLFRHFDADNSSKLDLVEVEKALMHLVKKNEDGTKTKPIVAYPPEFKKENGDVELPEQWFWSFFKAME